MRHFSQFLARHGFDVYADHHIEKGLDDVTGARRKPRKCGSGIEATVG
jgi:hypothetical protein